MEQDQKETFCLLKTGERGREDVSYIVCIRPETKHETQLSQRTEPRKGAKLLSQETMFPDIGFQWDHRLHVDKYVSSFTYVVAKQFQRFSYLEHNNQQSQERFL